MVQTPPADPAHELIQALCLEAGRIMEDASVDLALTLPDDPDELTQRIRNLVEAAYAIDALAHAAKVLLLQVGR